MVHLQTRNQEILTSAKEDVQEHGICIQKSSNQDTTLITMDAHGDTLLHLCCLSRVGDDTAEKLHV